MDFGILIGILGIAFSAFTYYRSEEIAKKSVERESERKNELRELNLPRLEVAEFLLLR